VRFDAFVYLYGRRLRKHPIQELLAALGIAIGVALAFAALVANGSVVDSAQGIVRGVTGTADLQLASRDARGFDEDLLAEVRRIPGVRRAAPLLDHRAVVIGRDGRQVPVALASVDPSLAALSGRLAGNFVAGGLRFVRGVMLPTAAARALGFPDPAAQPIVRPLPSVTLALRGRTVRTAVAAVLGRETIGPLSKALVVIVPLRRLQAMTGLRGRITRILIDTHRGSEVTARTALASLARAHHLSLAPATSELSLLRQALRPSDQATGFFAAISALLGFLLAFNAMLLTAPERRRTMVELRIQGFKPRQLVTLMLLQALVLGTVASAAGIAVGDLLSRTLFNDSPGYLAPAFTLGMGTAIGWVPIVLAILGGVAACCLAAAPPLLDLRRGRAVDAVFHTEAQGNALGVLTRNRLLICALVLFALAGALLFIAPAAALAACAILALATVAAIPTSFSLVLRAAETLTDRMPRFNMLAIALLALRATTLRSLALAATGAVAVFGSVAIGGARDDLLRGIAHFTSDYVGTADIWVVNRNDNQATNDIQSASLAGRVAAIPGVAAVRTYTGGFIDFGGRRVWIIARPKGDSELLPASQIVRGDLQLATARLRQSGWIAVSDQIARARDIAPGDALTLPTPTGSVRYRVAATTTNLGWTPGAVILNSTDYRHAWNDPPPTALEIDTKPTADLDATRRSIQAALGPQSGLLVQTAAQRAAGINASAEAGLKRLGQISLLLLVSAVLAMAAAMGAAIWQRRGALAALRIQSFRPRQLWRVLLLETTLVLGAGCLTGALAGVYGQLAIDRYLKLVTGFPVAPIPAGWQTVDTFGLVVLAALAVVAVPGWFATRVPPHLGLQE
jgi:putative ABC transport system permease protein